MTDKTAFPSDSADKVLVRMPDGMRDRLKDQAKANNRTMNAEIISRLQDSFTGVVEGQAHADSKRPEFDADEIADKVVERLERKNDPAHNKAAKDILDSYSMIEPFGDIRDSYLKYARHVLESAEMPVPIFPKPIQKGPQRSKNARKLQPK